MTCSFGTSFEKFDFLGRLRRPPGRILVWLCSGLLAVVCQSQALLKAADNVDGNLITLNPDGNWSWYMDERAIVDPNNGHMLVNSVGYSPTVGGSANVEVVDFNPVTGRRVRTRLSNQVPGNPSIQSDDHNVGALLVLPDGRYLEMYANHGNNGGLGDEFSRWRRSVNPGDSTSWATEQLFNWFNNFPGANTTCNPEATNLSYHNLFFLSASPGGVAAVPGSRIISHALEVIKCSS